jgi:carbonic anhydrase/acetyltransferase-like protein (isoleucine patch superfamily)
MPLYELDGLSPELSPDGSSWVAPDASVIGKVTLGARASVWFGAVIRGDNERITLGAGSNVQDLSMLHTDEGFPLDIAEGCTIGHKCILHGCTIGANSLIGMGATVMNGVKIGESCIIGAGALLQEGREIPDRSLVVGMPGKVIRQIDDKTAEFLKWSANHYVRNAARFNKSLKRI